MWGFSEVDLAMVDLTPAAHHASPPVVGVLAVSLPGKDAANGVQRTCAELRNIASERQPNAWCWDERKDGPKPVRRLDGRNPRPGIRLSWSHPHRRISLSDNWADYYQDRFASPELVVAPFNVTRSLS